MNFLNSFYQKEDRRRNINPYFWGGPAWIFIFSIIESYPEKPNDKEKQMFFYFFISLMEVLPCDGCRRNYSAKLYSSFNSKCDFSLDPENECLFNLHEALESKTKLQRWGYALKRYVNQVTNNGKKNITFSEYVKSYSPSVTSKGIRIIKQ